MKSKTNFNHPDTYRSSALQKAWTNLGSFSFCIETHTSKCQIARTSQSRNGLPWGVANELLAAGGVQGHLKSTWLRVNWLAATPEFGGKCRTQKAPPPRGLTAHHAGGARRPRNPAGIWWADLRWKGGFTTPKAHRQLTRGPCSENKAGVYGVKWPQSGGPCG